MIVLSKTPPKITRSLTIFVELGKVDVIIQLSYDLLIG